MGACDEVDWQARQGKARQGGRGRSVAEWREEEDWGSWVWTDLFSVVHVLGIYLLYLRVPSQDPMHVEDHQKECLQITSRSGRS